MSYSEPPGGPGVPPGAPYGAPGQPGYNQGGYNQPGYNQGGYDPGAYGQPQAGGRKHRRTLLWVLLGLFVLVIGGIGACTAGVYLLARGPVDGANAWVAMVDQGDYQGAYQSMCVSTRAGNDVDAAVAELTGDFGAGIDGYHLTSVENTNGVVNVSGTIEIGGGTRNIEFLLRNEDGWKVCSYTL